MKRVQFFLQKKNSNASHNQKNGFDSLSRIQKKKVQFFESHSKKNGFDSLSHTQKKRFNSLRHTQKEVQFFESNSKRGSILLSHIQKSQFFESYSKKVQFFESNSKKGSII